MIHTCTPFLCCLFFLFPLFYVYLSLEHFTGKVVRLLLPSKQPAHTRSHTTHIISYHFPTTQTTREGAKERGKNTEEKCFTSLVKIYDFQCFQFVYGCRSMFGYGHFYQGSIICMHYHLHRTTPHRNRNNQFRLLEEPSGHVNFSINLNRPKSKERMNKRRKNSPFRDSAGEIDLYASFKLVDGKIYSFCLHRVFVNLIVTS